MPDPTPATTLEAASAGSPAARHARAVTPAVRFYGWRVVWASFAVLFVAYGLQFSFGVFVHEITDESGLSRAQLLLPYAVYVALYSWLSWGSGWATDRFGPRRVVAIGAFVLGLGWAGLGASRSLWQVYVTLGLVAAIGMSATWVPCNATVVRWFVRRRGLAVGVASSGGAMGNVIVPPLAALLIAAIGWRAALPTMAGLAAVTMFVCARFMVRDPEQIGLHPDGDSCPPGAIASSLADEDSYTGAEARRTAAFWCVFALYALSWVAVFVPFAHAAAFAEDLGYRALAASLLLSAIGVGGVTGRLAAGPLSDRIGRRLALVLLLGLEVVAFAGFATAHDLWLLYPSAAAFGAGYGGSTAILPALVGDQFGRRYAGAIVGQIFAGAGAMAAVGPYVAAALYDATASYRVAFLLGGACNLVAMVLATLLQPPRARARSVRPTSHVVL